MSEKKQKVLVIGAGVVGLSCGVLMAENGYEVEVWSSQYSPNTTSDLAGGIVFLPDCPDDDEGLQGKQRFMEYSKNEKETGVELITTNILSRDKKKPAEDKLKKMQILLPEFRLCNAEELRGAQYGWHCKLPVVQPTKYLQFLQKTFQSLGGVYKLKEVKNISTAIKESSANILINCTGLGARELCNDQKMFPIRGQLVQLDPNFLREEDRVLYFDEENPKGYTYIIPRRDVCLLGGTAQPQNYDLSVHAETTIVTPDFCFAIELMKNFQGIIERVDSLLPELKVKQQPIKGQIVGLRPGRIGGPRVEVEVDEETKALIVHNYGHAGLGVSLSWTYALKVLNLIKQHQGTGVSYTHVTVE